ncbi:MAG: rRNA adenine N-6-methyltransferase family protein [Candidatus Woesearchaeota archaeon]|jgi:16S rRNA (adenine1518-N6/adenine1519-N6)-dimethyltransferase
MSELKHDQHFLQDPKVIEASLKAAELKKTDVVLEIGPGKGVLTAELAKKCKTVIAIELDQEFKDDLATLPKNVEVIFGNALELMEFEPFNKIVANIPYSISEPLLKKMLKLNFDLAVLLVGQKFAELLVGKSKWNSITNLFFRIEKLEWVPRECFSPKPRVDSMLIKLEKRTTKLTEPEQIIKELISQDDKKIKNALMFSFMRVRNITKKQAKEQMDKLLLYKELLNKRVEHLSNVQFEILEERIKLL